MIDVRGNVLAHTADGLELELRGALPGERVTAEVVHTSGRGRLFGVVREVSSASPDRVPVLCGKFLTCGGCDLLHASRPVQHAMKRRAVAEALGLELERVAPVIAADQALGYRALAKLVVGPDRVLGSYRLHSHQIADMSGCVVSAPLVEMIADRIREILAGLSGPIDLRYVLIRGALTMNKVIVTLVSREKFAQAPRAISAMLEDVPEVARVVLHVNAAEGDALIGEGPDVVLLDRGSASERLGAVDQGLESGAFAQINPSAAALLYAHVRDVLQPRGRRILDLYSGSGGIALTLAEAGAEQVHGIERSPEAVEAAKKSAQSMGLSSRVTFEAAAVEAGLAGAPLADAVVLNPPRRGSSPAILSQLAARAPLSLVYVSCDPGSLARDLAALSAQAAVELRSVTPFDLFPQTRHVETVVHAELRALP